MTSAAIAPTNKRFTVWVANRTNLMVGIFGLLIVIVLALFPIFAGTPWTRRLVDFFTLLALAQFWNLMLGYAGLISVGQQGFIGMGSGKIVFHGPLDGALAAGGGEGLVGELPGEGIEVERSGFEGELAFGWGAALDARRICQRNDR